MSECENCKYWENGINDYPCDICNSKYSFFSSKYSHSPYKNLNIIQGEFDNQLSQLEFEMCRIIEINKRYEAMIRAINDVYQNQKQELGVLKRKVYQLEHNKISKEEPIWKRNF